MLQKKCSPNLQARHESAFATRGGGGGGYFHTYVGSGHFFGFKILNLNILGFFRKMNIFGGMKILLICFWVITKMDYIMHFRGFP